MAFSAAEIEQIVREVIRRLEHATSPNGMPTPSKDFSSRELHLNVPVVSVARLEGKLVGVKQVVVSLRAVVTPAAKDLLREKKIRLVRDAVASSRAEAKQMLVAGVAETKFEPAPLWQQLRSENIQIEELARSGVVSVTTELCEQVTRAGRLGVLLTDDVAAAVCLANRTRGIRAAEARCATSTRAAVKSIGVNVLVVNPAGKSTFELKRMVDVLLAGGGRCPAGWQGKLE